MFEILWQAWPSQSETLNSIPLTYRNITAIISCLFLLSHFQLTVPFQEPMPYIFVHPFSPYKIQIQNHMCIFLVRLTHCNYENTLSFDMQLILRSTFAKNTGLLLSKTVI